ncbi:MAG: outer membrane protein transport protein [Hyphomicrobium sp.]|nr:outer membrane protein transport protein [Hyphomicrobium sp.]
MGAKGAVVVCSVLTSCGPALGGGLGVREQSTSAQGASFAGAGSGGDLSSSFWNPAAMSLAGPGLATESHVSLLYADIDVRANSVSVLPGTALGSSTALVDDHANVDQLVAIGASYASWRVDKDLVLGLAVNAPFGSKNKAQDPTWSGEYHFRSSQLLTVNVNPIASYQLAPGLFIGAGPQLQYLALTIKANPSGGLAPSQSNSVLDGDDIGLGFTGGVLWQPSPATSIGLGFRSSVAHEIEGDASMAAGFLTTGLGTAPFAPIDFEAKLRTPEIATLSLRQALSDTTRLLATVEWSNWSRLDKVDFIATSQGGLGSQPIVQGQAINILDFHWDDGWFFALGAEWDASNAMTLRAGAAYEISPIRDPEQRKINVSDSDRIWLSVGATYALTAAMAFDLAYTHIFFDDAPIDSLTTTPASATTPVRRFTGSADQAADIVSLSLKTKW